VDACGVPRQHPSIPPSPTATAPVRVLIVDDGPFFQEVARELIDATSGFEYVGAAYSGEEGIDQAERLRPDLVLMDVRMPGIGGIEAARRMSACGSRAVVVLVSADEGLTEVRPGGAPQVVPKRKLCRTLLRALWDERGVLPLAARA
jgi:CheY-like chemotaxis protein